MLTYCIVRYERIIERALFGNFKKVKIGKLEAFCSSWRNQTQWLPTDVLYESNSVKPVLVLWFLHKELKITHTSARTNNRITVSVKALTIILLQDYRFIYKPDKWKCLVYIRRRMSGRKLLCLGRNRLCAASRWTSQVCIAQCYWYRSTGT